MSKFSIIIPVYNVAPYLRECLDSVLAQTFTDWEAVCVDDGSVDGSGAILDEYAAKDVRFKVVHQKNQGVVAARVTGYNHSKGQMILFLDGDDEITHQALEVINQCQREYDSDIVQYGFEMRMSNGEINLNKPFLLGYFVIDDLVRRIHKTPLEILGMCIGNKCYRRRVVEKAFDMVSHIRISHSEDGLFAFAAFLTSDNISFVEDCLYVYKLRAGSAVTRVNRNIVKEKVLFINKLEDLAKKSNLFNQAQITRMINFHKYEAACYVFLMLSRNGGVLNDYKILLAELQGTDFMNKENREWSGLKRRGLRVLIFHPFLCWLLNFLRGIVR